ncbi:uncharacterized protein [Solanum tuberosum]|nr:PREDICTED: uncharacterized protein LOC102599015 [Solanum tuberosum]
MFGQEYHASDKYKRKSDYDKGFNDDWTMEDAGDRIVEMTEKSKTSMEDPWQKLQRKSKKKSETSTADKVQKKVHDVKTMTKDTMDSVKMLDKCIYDYFVKKGMRESAKEFASEVDVENPTDDATKSPGSFLTDWWNVFYDMLISNQSAQDPYAEAARTMDNVVPQVPYAVPTSSSHSVTPAHNISLVVPAFSLERSQEPCHLRMPEDEVPPKLRFLDVDRPSQGAAFVTDSSRLMEQIPNMPQQWEAKDEGEGQGIYFDQTMQMEPNGDTPKNFVLPVPDPCEAGSSIGSCSGMQQTP